MIYYWAYHINHEVSFEELGVSNCLPGNLPGAVPSEWFSPLVAKKKGDVYGTQRWPKSEYPEVLGPSSRGIDVRLIGGKYDAVGSCWCWDDDFCGLLCRTQWLVHPSCGSDYFPSGSPFNNQGPR